MILIFPPGWAPSSPFLALPQLKGFLNREGYDAEIADENLVFFDTLISSKYLQNNIIQLKKRWDVLNNLAKRNEKEQEEFLRLTKIILIEEDYKKIDLIKNNYRNGNDFSGTELDSIFGVASSIVEEKYKDFKISVTGITNVKYNLDSISSLKKYLKDQKNNLYYDFFLNDSKILNKVDKHLDIGISITGASQLYSCLTLIKLIREKYGKSKRIFFGGNFITRIATYYPEKLSFLFEYIDFISVGDGEYTLKSLLEKKKLCNIPNIAFYNELGKLEFTKTKYFDLKDLVIPNFDGLELDKYFSSKLILPIFSSRSCYSKCSFCTIAKATSGPYRVYSIEQILEMINVLQNKYNCNFFTFVDETFNAKRLLEFSKKVITSKLKFYWYTETRFDYYLNREETDIIYRAGCRKMQFGVESYNENVLELMNKNIHFKDIKNTIHNFIDSGIGVHLFFMIGFPGETKENSENTFQFMNEIVEYGYERSDSMLVTNGFGTFGLEIGSPVQNDPKKFKINILTDFKEKDFIGLGLDYSILGDFLSPEEAENIVTIKKDFGLSNFISFNKSLFTEMQNFLEITLPIDSNLITLDTSDKIFKINYGLFKEEDCKYLLTNFSKQKLFLINDKELLAPLYEQTNDHVFSEDLLKNKKFKLNPMINWRKKENDLFLKNQINGETFKIEHETLEEILKFQNSKDINETNFLDSDYLNFYNFILSNNIIY